MKNKIQLFKFLLKSLFLIFFSLMTFAVKAPETTVAFILASEPVDAYERLIKAVVKVESAGNTLAYNLAEEAVGAFQIRPIRILDYNQRTGKNYKIENCYNFDISKEVFLYYAREIGYPDYETIARNWNGSGKTTQDYWEKVKSNL